MYSMLHLSIGRHAYGVVASMESDKLGFEHQVSIDTKAALGRGLKTTKAG